MSKFQAPSQAAAVAETAEARAAGLGLTPVRHARFAERVYDSLFHSILTGTLALDARLPSEAQLATFFQVSRPVVRQAIERLRQDGLVESQRGSGTYVRATGRPAGLGPEAGTSTDMGHILHGLELRLIVEPECARLAALRRKPADLDQMAAMLDRFESAAARGDVAHHFDYGFHAAVARASANPRLLQVLASLEYDVSHAVNLWRHMARMEPWLRTQDALDEHRAILELIRQQDAEGACRAMRGHVERARIRMLEDSPQP